MFGRATIEVEKQREQHQREHHADAEEDRQRLVAAVARLHEPQPQRAQLLRRARRLLADALEQADQALEARLRPPPRGPGPPTVSSSSRRSIAAARLGINAIAPAVMISDPKTNASSGSNIVTRYTSILMTCLIHR